MVCILVTGCAQQDEFEEDQVGNFERLILSKKHQLRVEYARNQSFPLDWQLFWETIGGVFRKAENAAKEKKRQN